MSTPYGFFLGDESTLYSALDFCEAFYHLIGDGVTSLANKLEVVSTNSMNVNVLPGTALSRGRYLTLNQSESLTIPPADNYLDRYDAVVFRSYRQSEQAELLVITGATSVPPTKYSPRRDEIIHEIVLAHILVERGVNKILPENILDTREDPTLCGYITSLGDISPSIVRAQKFIETGIDQRAEELMAESEMLANRAKALIQRVNATLGETGNNPLIGDLKVLKGTPTPSNEWLLCDGSPIPTQFQSLITLLGNKLPNIPSLDLRIKTWIYAGPTS